MTLDADRIAAALPKYEIGREIGRGAWGVVLTAEHRQLGRSVAIKQLPRSFAGDPMIQRRFAAEARLLASLDHPHIVPIFDYVEEDGLCMLVMELLPGGTVRDRFTAEGIRADAACTIVLATCAALQYAHVRGILHRDVKPENLLFNASGTLKVTDFGIAKVLGGAETLATKTGDVLGTPAYMAPEQVTGKELTAATDVYAVATMLYELLSGQLPFSDEGGLITALFRHVYEAPTPLLEVAPVVPEALAIVVMRGLATDPLERHRSAEDFGVAVAEAANDAWRPGWMDATDLEIVASKRVAERISNPGGHPAPARIDQPSTAAPRPSDAAGGGTAAGDTVVGGTAAGDPTGEAGPDDLVNLCDLMGSPVTPPPAASPQSVPLGGATSRTVLPRPLLPREDEPGGGDLGEPDPAAGPARRITPPSDAASGDRTSRDTGRGDDPPPRQRTPSELPGAARTDESPDAGMPTFVTVRDGHRRVLPALLLAAIGGVAVAIVILVSRQSTGGRRIPVSRPAPSSPAASSNPVLFADDFSDHTAGWAPDANQDGAGSAVYKSDGYYVTALRPLPVLNTFSLASPYSPKLVSVSVAADITFVTGVPSDGAGVRCDQGGRIGLRYSFEIAGDGSWVIFRIDQGNTALRSGTSAAIRTGGASNTVSGQCTEVGDGVTQLVMTVNGVELGSAHDAHAPGAIGWHGALIVYRSMGSPGTVVRFNSFQLRAPG